jgi:hypothetical protein
VVRAIPDGYTLSLGLWNTLQRKDEYDGYHGSVSKRDDGRYEGELRTLTNRAEVAIVR